MISDELKRINTMVSTADTVGAVGSIASGALVASMALGSAFSSGSSPQLIFTMFGYYQLLISILILKYHIPESLEQMLLNFGVFKLDFSFITDFVPKGDVIVSNFASESIPQSNAKLSTIGYESGSMIDNYFWFFMSIGFTLFIHILYIFLHRIICLDNYETTKINITSEIGISRMQRLQVNVYMFFHLSVYVTGILEGVMFLYLN